MTLRTAELERGLLMSDSAFDVLRSMGIDPEEAIAEAEEREAAPKTDKRICSCGHAISRHYEADLGGDRGIRVECSAQKGNCSCKSIDPVLTVEDKRLFLRKTEGPFGGHALTQGIVASAKVGVGVEWIPDAFVCASCGTKEGPLSMTPVYPVVFNVADYDTGVNHLLCGTCLLKGRSHDGI